MAEFHHWLGLKRIDFSGLGFGQEASSTDALTQQETTDMESLTVLVLALAVLALALRR
jgi:hypothetical protein